MSHGVISCFLEALWHLLSSAMHMSLMLESGKLSNQCILANKVSSFLCLLMVMTNEVRSLRQMS